MVLICEVSLNICRISNVTVEILRIYEDYITTTIVYAKFGGQTECIMDNWKIVNKFYRYPVKINCEITY